VARLTIIWSEIALDKLEEILNFYTSRNVSDSFSKKLYKKIIDDVRILAHSPFIGFSSRIKNVRGLIIDDFIVYYEIKNKLILILTIWDCSQNPNQNKFTN
jgi:plasmid stabilization system protein ParE